MNTSKQINVMILLLFFSVLVTAGYTLWDSGRANEAEDEQQEATIRRGAYLFSQNCRVCHGDAGEGGAASDRLRAAPALNRADLQGDVDGEITDVTFANAYKLVYDTISCGRVGKVMPAWAQVQGGTLNDEQIKQLTYFITQGGDEGWAIAAEFGRFNEEKLHLNSADNRNELTLAEAIGEDDTVLHINGLRSSVGTALVNPGERLSILEEIEAPAEGEGDGEEEVVIPETIEVMVVIQDDPDTEVNEAVDLDAGTVTVERGVGGTAQAHAAGTHLLQPPSPPAEPAVVERACGQSAAAQPTLPPPTPTTAITLTAQATTWNYTQLSAIAGEALNITVQNNDEGVQHNWVLYDGDSSEADRLAETDLATGVSTQTADFGPLDAGDYYYNCEIHPGQMEGILTSYPPGEGPEGAAAPAADATATP